MPYGESQHGLADAQMRSALRNLLAVVGGDGCQAEDIEQFHFALIDKSQAMQIPGRPVDRCKNLALSLSMGGHGKVSSHRSLACQRGDGLLGATTKRSQLFRRWPAIGVGVEKAKLRNKAKLCAFLQLLGVQDQDEMSNQGHVSLDQTPPWLATLGGADPGAQGLDRGPPG